MAQSNGLTKLPLEMLHEIAGYIEEDKNICDFSKTCKAIYHALNDNNGSFWRRRFLLSYDLPIFDQRAFDANTPAGLDNDKYRKLYIIRKRWQDQDFVFGTGDSVYEKINLHIAFDMFTQCYNKSHGDKTTNSLNLPMLSGWSTFQTNIATPFVPPKRGSIHAPHTKLILMVQCLVANIVLRVDADRLAEAVHRYYDTQLAVYSHPDARPFFGGRGGTQVDVEMAVHHLNFWKYWFNQDRASHVKPFFRELPDHELPQWWKSKLTNDLTHIGKQWKGTYAYLEEADLDRLRNDERRQFHDEFPGGRHISPFQDVQLWLVDESEHYWPACFEQHFTVLNHQLPEERTRAQRKTSQGTGTNLKVHRFTGIGTDQRERFTAQGWIESLPPQMGCVNGWKRMVMMKYYVEATGVIDMQSLWAYEGFILPGNQVIVGRWWRADGEPDEFYSGPFILWCVDK